MYFKWLSQILVLMLILIAAVVCVGFANGANMWAYIVFYWFVLTLKNFADFVAGAKDAMRSKQ